MWGRKKVKLLANLHYVIFMKHLISGDCIDETSFCFLDDPEKREHIIGYAPEVNEKKPYWVGLCDIPGGCDFASADELVSAEIFDGQSIRERWKKILFLNVGGIGIDCWKRCFAYDRE